ncbi:MAG TPA: EAL domain-containing protein [Gammaproteobacteria bacterium]|nr:EAL domain-containing protein [Gammaproteobacteria bacterium]
MRQQTVLDLLASADTIEENMQIAAVALCEVLGAFGAGVAVLSADAVEAHILAFQLHGKRADVTDYRLLNTPCADVYFNEDGGKECYIDRDVCGLFPEDQLLQQLGAESYWGRPLLDHLQCPIGHVFAIGHKRLQLAENDGLIDAISARVQRELQSWKDSGQQLQQQQFWQQAIENMPYGAACFVLGGQPLWMNLAAAQLLGYESVAASMKMQLQQHLSGEDVKRIVEYQRARAAGKRAPGQYRLKIRTLQGQVRDLQMTVSKIDWHGSPAFLCLIGDITELVSTERRLEYYRQTVSASPDLIYFMDQDYIIRAANHKLAEALDLDSAAELIDQPVAQVFSSPMRNARLYDSYHQALEGKTVAWEDWRQLPVLGRRYLEVKMAPYINVEGEVEGVSVVSHDITRRLRNQELLAERERYLASLLSSLPGMAYRSQDARREQMYFVSAGCEAICGYSPDVLQGEQGRHWSSLIVDEERQGVNEEMNEALSVGKPFALSYRIIHEDGSERQICERGTGVWNTGGELMGVEGFIRDITDAHKMSQSLSYQATHDFLTRIINRREFSRVLDELLADPESRSNGICTCYLDLDEFKIVNDTAGHSAGDKLLESLCGVLAGQLRQDDVLGRLGGDEFGVIIRGCSSEAALQVAEKLRHAVSRFRFLWAESVFSIGVSIGLVSVTDDMKTVEDVLRIADGACLLAKEKGRNQVYVADQKSREMELRQDEMNWSLRINQALDHDGFLLYAQPIVAANKPSGKHHFEVLLRMQIEDRVIAPGLFLPAAERYHLARRIDMWVIEHALGFFAEHPESLHSLRLCMINLSGLSLSNPLLAEEILEWLDKCRVPASKIGFEITETAAISELDHAVHFIKTVQARGCQVALDDFGSGLSSFAYLRYLPVDIVKIDGAIVRECAHDSMSRGIVKSVHDIALLGGMRTVAEFVENEAIIKIVREIGIDYLQGYAIGKPLPLAALMNAA